MGVKITFALTLVGDPATGGSAQMYSFEGKSSSSSADKAASSSEEAYLGAIPIVPWNDADRKTELWLWLWLQHQNNTKLLNYIEHFQDAVGIF